MLVAEGLLGDRDRTQVARLGLCRPTDFLIEPSHMEKREGKVGVVRPDGPLVAG